MPDRACLGSGKGLETFLRNLEHSLGLFVYDTNISDEIAISLISKRIDRDFDDTLFHAHSGVSVI